MRRPPAPPLALAALVFLAVLVPAPSAGAARPAPAAPTGRVLVLLDQAGARTPARAAATRAFVARSGARPAGPVVPEIGLVTVRPRPGQSVASLARALRDRGGVRSAAPEGRMQFRFAPNDPALFAFEDAPGTPAGIPRQWPVLRHGLFRAWDFQRGDGAVVGVIDSGVDATHPDLQGKIAAAVDQDANPDSGPPGVDESGHGTHVASLACAASNNGVGIAGAGLNCRLLIEKSDLTDASIAQSIVDAANRGVLALNMSFGDDGSRGTTPAITAAIDYAYSRRVVMVAAGADDRVAQQGQPANLLQPTGTGARLDQGRGLSVTAAAFDGRPSGAGFGSQISLAAYGSFQPFGESGGPRGLLGAFPGNLARLEQEPFACNCRTTVDGDGRYAYLQGTSMAAPQVAAIAAMMRRRNPDLSVRDVLTILKRTARRAAPGWTPDLGWGILAGDTALDLASRVDRRAPTSRLRGPRLTRSRYLFLRWSGARDLAAPGLRPAGILAYEVWASINGRPYRRVFRTLRTSLRFRATPGARHAFFTVAVDRQGNREPRPRLPDARTTVLR